MPSVILRDTKLQGNLTQKDSITIDGSLIGDIKSQEIIVNENGNIIGNLTADINIQVAGQVNGDLSSERIHLNSTAKIKGKLFHRSLVVDDGAQLEIAALTKKKLNNKNNNVL
jgi:cytoskeletal protein CcmA (bactofilin family)